MKKTRKLNQGTFQSKRLIKEQMLSHANLNPENLKINFEVLTGICETIERSTEGKQVFERMLNLIGKSVEFSRASLFLLNKKENHMEEVASVGRKVDLIDFVCFDAGLGLSAWVAKEKRPILLSNIRRKHSGDVIKSFLTIPLILNGELFGVINFGHIRAHAFEPEEVRFLTLASLPMTLCLERMFYHSEMERVIKELEQEKENTRKLQEKISQMESRIPTLQLLEDLNEKIKTPLSGIVENAEFLLNSFSSRQDDKSSSLSRKESKLEFKRGLKEIKNEVNQITKATEKLLKRSSTLSTWGGV